MENPEKPFAELVNIVKSWIPRRPDTTNVSRDFWMPDHSCRVCYDCDSQFTIFNRRHHCRICGRIFCGKCTANSIPIPCDCSKSAREEVGEWIRACNYCFRQWKKNSALVDSHSITCLTPCFSTTSLVSTKSTGTNNATSTAGSFSAGPYQHVFCSSDSTLEQSAQMDPCLDKQDIHASARTIDSVSNTCDHQFHYGMNRSDDDDDEYGVFHDSEEQCYQHSDGYYGQVEFEEVDQDYHPNEMHLAEERVDSNETCSPVQENIDLLPSLSSDKMDEETEADNSYECDASSSLYGIENADAEPEDFESNGLTWLPPEPEDEEDELEALVVEDENADADADADADATGEWDSDRSSNSFGSGDYRSRDRSNEEHKKAMKNVVDGHFRALIAQLLQVENLHVGEEGDKESWLEIVTYLSWEAATLLKPDTSKGGGMDPGGYVKVKCLACGRRSESKAVKGVVFKKNVAHRRMASRVEKPRFLILGGALEYQRVTNLLSSFDTLLQQEMDHLKMAVAKIAAHKPNVLLVEKSVSRFAQEYLLAKGISLVLNIKRPLLERISRCTGAQIIPSIDHLSPPMLGRCDLFHVEKFLENHVTAGQAGRKMTKTLMFFEGCPRPLGCTVLLKGANLDELKKVKHVVQYGVFAAYHLALETSFLADEGASLPELPLRSPITVALPDKPPSVDRSISVIPGFMIPASSNSNVISDAQKTSTSGPIVSSTVSGESVMEASPFPENQSLDIVRCVSTDDAKTWIKRCLKERSNHVDHVLVASNRTSLSTHDAFSTSSSPRPHTVKEKNKVSFGETHETASPKTDDLVSHDSHIPVSTQDSLEKSEKGSCIVNDIEVNHMVEKQLSVCNEETLCQNVVDGHDQIQVKEEFPPPSDHQSILVSLSTRCVWKGTVCERSQLFRIKYYGNFDKPLGRFLRDHLFDQSYKCRSCDSPSEAHVHCYTHRQGSLTISVRQLPESFILPGERDGKIWMWHRCLLCPRNNGFPPATRRVVMSDAAWGLSFGKFLELSFSNHAAASRAASCGHSLHRDCLRFYGYGKMVACFRYAAIKVHSVYLPPSKVDFDYQHQEWIQKEANEVAEKVKLLYNELQKFICQFVEKTQNDGVELSELRHHLVELEELLHKEKTEFEDALHRVFNGEARKGQPVIDLLVVNRLRRQIVLYLSLWYQRFALLAESDIRSKEMLNTFVTKDKEKLYSVDKIKDLSTTMKPQKDFYSSNAVPLDPKTDEPLKEGMHVADHVEDLLGVHNHIQQRSDIDLDLSQEKQSKTSLHTSISATEQSISLEYGLVGRRTLSDGQVPVMTNLSETFDAKWTGNNAIALPDFSMLDSLVPIDTSASLPLLSDIEQRTGADATQSFASLLISKLGDSAEDISSRLGILNIYRSINRNWGGTSKFNDSIDCNSVFSFLLQELEYQSVARFLHIGVNDTVIPIYDDEPTSIIAFALVSHEYHSQLSEERERIRDGLDSSLSLPLFEAGNFCTSHSLDEIYSDPFRSFGSAEESSLSLSGSRGSLSIDQIAYTKAMHARVSFTSEGPLGKVKYSVTCYYAKPFDDLRRACCPSEVDFIRSLSRCKKWGAQGGKSNVFFAKSLDDRFIVKQVTKTELESFIKFAPQYFKYLSDSIATGSPTCLAKILGIYQVTFKNLKGGKELRMDVLVMENLLFRRNITRLYDLKGSSRSRYNADSSGNNKVLLDQNLIEAMPTSPIFVGNKAKRVLERAVWNDTSFLASIDVMDYSLLVGVDEEKHELVLGIIDFMRQYTWDKHLETWVKASGILGGPKNVSPTVVSPKQYKKRFRKAMSAYFLVVPDQWSPPTIVPSKLQTEICEDNQHDTSVRE